MRKKKERHEALLPSVESEDIDIDGAPGASIFGGMSGGSSQVPDFDSDDAANSPRKPLWNSSAKRTQAIGSYPAKGPDVNFFQRNVSDTEDMDSNGIFEDPGMDVNLPDFSVAALPKLDASELSGSQADHSGGPVIGSYNPKRRDAFSFADEGSGVVDQHVSLPTPYSEQGVEVVDGLGHATQGLAPPVYDEEDTGRVSPEFHGFRDMDKTEGSMSRQCAICQVVIEGPGIVANGRYYHQTCVKCAGCGIMVSNGNAVLCRDQFLCRFCAQRKPDTKRCDVCGMMIEKPDVEVAISGLPPRHKDCLACYLCGKKMRKGEERVVEGVTVCGMCSVQAPKCAKCDERIFGAYVKNHGKFYHPEHWTCSVCGKVLSPTIYIMHHNKPLCLEHGEIYRTTCAFCKRHFQFGELDKIKWKKKYYHVNCFVCRVCGVDLTMNKCKSIHGRPHCRECFSQRVKDGDCNGDGRTVGKHKHHHPMEAVERMEHYRTAFGRTIIHPIYGKPEFEETGELQRDFAIDVG